MINDIEHSFMCLLALIPFLDSSLLMYRNTTDFCMLILFLAALLNLFFSSHSVLVQSLGFSIYNIRSSANRDSLTFSRPTWMPCVYFSFPVALARISSSMLGRSLESEETCHVPDLRG